ncbi:MAG: hypothetical protein WD360_06335, partial [Nitriliruptoraceae bacterium]
AVTIAFLTAPFSTDGRVLIGLAWGRVTIIDLYLALGVFVLWVGWRDGITRGLLWGAIAVVSGSAGIGIYLLLATRNAANVQDVLLGSRSNQT